uniref:Uncharacterized protein n=1 Tax=Magallana gigas TaxID=29159 RepID=K1QGN3_MAGGI
MLTDGPSLPAIGNVIYLIPEWAEEEQVHVPGSTAARFFGTRGRVHREEEANITGCNVPLGHDTFSPVTGVK